MALEVFSHQPFTQYAFEMPTNSGAHLNPQSFFCMCSCDVVLHISNNLSTESASPLLTEALLVDGEVGCLVILDMDVMVGCIPQTHIASAGQAGPRVHAGRAQVVPSERWPHSEGHK